MSTETPLAHVPGSSRFTAATTYPLDVTPNDEAGNLVFTRSTPYSYLAAASANQDSQVVKASAATLNFVQLGNTTASVRYVKVYDKATSPTSADTPVQRWVVPGSTAGGGNNPNSFVGMKFTAGLAFRITTGVADSDATAATANDVVVNFGYV